MQGRGWDRGMRNQAEATSGFGLGPLRTRVSLTVCVIVLPRTAAEALSQFVPPIFSIQERGRTSEDTGGPPELGTPGGPPAN